MAFTKLVPLDQWRCKKCGKSASEGGNPRYKHGNTLPCGTCTECELARNRVISKAANRRERIKMGRNANADPTFRFPKSELSRRYRSNAASCETRASQAEQRGDSYEAARLRDQANDWIALAAKPYAP